MANEMNMNQKNVEELVRSIPILAATGNTEAVNRVLDLIDEMRKAEAASVETPKVGKYFYARVLTLADGTKHYHPMIGAMSSMNDVKNPSAYKMTAKDSILELQNDYMANGQKRMAEAAGYKIQAVFVTEEVYAELERKLVNLMTSVIEGLGGDIPKIMNWLNQLNDKISEEEVLKELLREVTNKPFVSGAAVNADGAIVEKGEYIDEVVARPELVDDDDNGDDEEDGCDGCDCTCCGCDNCPGC
jgi:sulfur carrier protein ThiS